MISLDTLYVSFSEEKQKYSIADNVQGMRRSSHLIKNNAKHCHSISGMWRSPELPQAAERIPFVIRSASRCATFIQHLFY
jgi:hypothetical protein